MLTNSPNGLSSLVPTRVTFPTGVARESHKVQLERGYVAQSGRSILDRRVAIGDIGRLELPHSPTKRRAAH